MCCSFSNVVCASEIVFVTEAMFGCVCVCVGGLITVGTICHHSGGAALDDGINGYSLMFRNKLISAFPPGNLGEKDFLGHAASSSC